MYHAIVLGECTALCPVKLMHAIGRIQNQTCIRPGHDINPIHLYVKAARPDIMRNYWGCFRVIHYL
jgi:hypothetical protein